MNIKLIREIRGSAIDISVEKGTAVEELYRQYKDSLPYTVLAAKIDNNSFFPEKFFLSLRPKKPF